MNIHEEHNVDFEIGNQDFAANRFLEKIITNGNLLQNKPDFEQVCLSDSNDAI